MHSDYCRRSVDVNSLNKCVNSGLSTNLKNQFEMGALNKWRKKWTDVRQIVVMCCTEVTLLR